MHPELLNRLGAQEYHHREPPKTIPDQYLEENLLPIFDEESFRELPVEVKLATSVQMVVDEVCRVVEAVQATLAKD